MLFSFGPNGSSVVSVVQPDDTVRDCASESHYTTGELCEIVKGLINGYLKVVEVENDEATE